jgi:hypothetical protein
MEPVIASLTLSVADASGCASGTGKLIFWRLRRAVLLFLDPLDSAQAEPHDGQTKRAVAGLNSGNFIAIISRWNWQKGQVSVSGGLLGVNIVCPLGRNLEALIFQ